ncbi:gustatory and pheromone receptor 39a-like [Rhagoletis pomonella]|uniref:gustatory and pheromone receptor 39a-like n=1 Tax=Rhagoletis pomonella TaxID=28610 RepID=UPI00177C7AD3|nr:gustatory and pheromone receptor 39a-like [Rhagoletis pomonella]
MSTTNITRLLRFYIKPLRCLGIIPILYCSGENKYILRTGWSFYAAHCSWQLLYVLAIGVLVIRRDEYFKQEHSYMEVNYWLLFTSTAMTVQFLTNTWLLNMSHSHFQIISYCVHLSERFDSYDRRKMLISQLILPLSVVSACAITRMWNFEPWIGLQIHYFKSSLSLAFYRFIIEMVSSLLSSVNASMVTVQEKLYRHNRLSDIDLENLQDCLVVYDELLLLCSEHISTLYGVILIFVTFISTLDITFCVYLMTTVTGGSYVERIITTLVYMVTAFPSLVLLNITLVGCDIEYQSSDMEIPTIQYSQIGKRDAKIIELKKEEVEINNKLDKISKQQYQIMQQLVEVCPNQFPVKNSQQLDKINCELKVTQLLNIKQVALMKQIMGD